MSNNKSLRFWLGVGASVLAITFARAAAAQEATEDGGRLSELIVTAEKRAVSIQDVPVAVSAYDDEARTVVGIENVQDIANFTPGMAYSTGQDRVTVRGVSRFTNNRSSEGGVAIYLDGVYSSSTTAGNLSTLFMDRTEVLRGPQGTLYGRNSVGGAVNFISKRPTDDFQGEARLGVGNYDTTNVEASYSGPITDHLRFRAVGSFARQGAGFFNNRSGGPSEGGRGDQSVAELQFEGDLFNEKLEWWFKSQWVRWDNLGRGPGGRSTRVVGEREVFPLVPSGLTPSPTFGYGPELPGTNSPRWFDADTPNKITLDYEEYTLDTVAHFGFFDLRYVGGYKYYDYNLQTDLDATRRTEPYVLKSDTVIGRTATNTDITASFVPANTGFLVFPKRENQYHEEPWWYSNELNAFSTHEGPLQWIVGLYQFKEASNYIGVDARAPDQAQFAAPITPLGALAPANPERRYAYNGTENVTFSYATFGQLDYQISDQWKVTGGVRYTQDRRTSWESARVFCFLAPSCAAAGGKVVDFSSAVYTAAPGDPSIVTPTFTDTATGMRRRLLKNDWEAVTGTLGLDWTPDDDTLVYAKYSRGYKAGGFNAGAIPANPTTAPEFINAYEIGAKKTFNAKFRANGSVFYYDYRDVQVPLSEIDPSGLTRTNFYNLPRSRILGLEVETLYYPTNNLQLMANYSYLDAEIKEACCFIDPQDPTALQGGAMPVTGTLGASRGQDLAGETLPTSTPHRVTVNANYSWNLAPGTLRASASYIWRSSTYYSIFNRDYNKAGAYGQADARLIFEDKDDRYTLIAYVKNVFDVEGRLGASADRSNTAPANLTTTPYTILNRTYVLAAPRTFGFEIQRRF